MAFTSLIFMKLAFNEQLFVKNCYTKMYENRTNTLIADTSTHTHTPAELRTVFGLHISAPLTS